MSVPVELLPGDVSAHVQIVSDYLSAAFENANSAVAIFDAEGKVLFANAMMWSLAQRGAVKCASLTGLAPEDQTGADYLGFERFRVGKIDRFRARYLASGDKSLLLDVAAHWQSFPNCQAQLAIVQMVDMSEVLAAQAAMKTNNARWETALSAAGQGVWEHDSVSGKLSVSHGWKRLRGIPDDEEVVFDRADWLERLHPEDRIRIDSESQKQGRTDGFDTLEYRERHRDGHYIWIYSRGRPYAWDDKGEVLLTIGTDTDISKPKALEEELAEEKERLHVILHSIADGVISTDAEGKVTFINQAASDMTGWMDDDALGQPIEMVFDSHAEGRGASRVGSVGSCLSTGDVIRPNGYTRLKRKTGRARYVREIAVPLRGENGNILGAVMAFQDATQRRKFQRQLEHSATHDVLTSLSNRLSFESHLKERIRNVNANGGCDALCLIDLDKFKAVNDGAGHSAGDALLKEIAGVIKASCRATDFVSRLGGDEFGVILHGCNIKTARQIMRRLIAQIGSLKFEWQGQTFQVGASVGITAIDGTTGNSTELYRHADNACYAAKRNGRNCEVVFG